MVQVHFQVSVTLYKESTTIKLITNQLPKHL